MKKIALMAVIALMASTSNAYASNSVTVFAASSLTESYTQIGKQFEKFHQGVKINFAFQASSTLAKQIKEGAPADIFVSADKFDGGTDYLVNRVVLGVPLNSAIKKISDLNNKLIWIQCAHEVPCGAAADAVLKSEDVSTRPVSYEPKVSSVVAKLVSGEVDAAIIYRTDVLANSKKIRAIEFSDRESAKTTYQIAQLRKNRWASTFMNYLNSKAVLKILAQKGFEVK
jgi:molybdate transport system substrate-binding protein